MIHKFIDIKVDDTLAYIQGMAMGRKAESSDISWEEVAIGLGHLLIAFNFLVIKYGYEYKKIEAIKFKGMQSELMLFGKKKAYGLINSKETERSFG